MQKLVSEARKRGAEAILLEVRESNCAARALYAKVGFREMGRREAYYTNPVEGGILYTLHF
jgi:ribosomal-protein-alanine N-acetyltransferase